ncbi:MAG: hypothetical protein KGD58_12360 [Candidatus Lokiarchaeota archaeon]|nr:hypothetical protein [Candidatus Lokiarchaeota archaeon]
MIITYQFNKELGDFEETVLVENVPLFELLDSNKILLFVDVHERNVWVWQGDNTSTRMKFVSSQTALHIRDKHDISFMIHSIDEGDETAAFKIFVGLV